MKQVDLSRLTSEERAELAAFLEARDKRAEIKKHFQPQPGPQEMFVNSQADITIYGGSAGGGKTYGLLLTCLRDIKNPKFGAVIFRRNASQVMNEGGLWSECMKLYPLIGAVPKVTPKPTMVFPSGSRISFAHLQFDNTVLDFQGAQISLIAFDELTHFTKQQFMYMMSRNRSVCGAKNRIVATTNPDPDSFVKDLISWWIDEDTGLAIKERSGIVRYFLVINDEFKWGDNRDELAFLYSVDPKLVKSFTFISSSVYDNKILLKENPEYLANLNALGEVQKGRLLDGNWKIRPASGMYFKRNKIKLVNSIPGKLRKVVRSWDLAASVPSPQYPNPDYTAGVLMGKLFDGRYIIIDVVHGRWTSSDVRKKVLETAIKDKEKYGRVTIRIPRDPGQAGVEQSESYIKLLAGHSVKVKRVTGDKVTRFEPFSAQCLADSDNVLVLIGDWNDSYFNELESFPPEKCGHDDQVDASSDSYSELVTAKSWSGLIN